MGSGRTTLLLLQRLHQGFLEKMDIRGKTRIALEYALRLKDSPVSVFWNHASTKTRVLDCYAKIAKKVKIAGYNVNGAQNDNPLLVKEWLESDASGRWLIILDNGDDHDMLYGPNRLIDIFPGPRMTTRDKKVAFDFAGASRLFRLQRLDSDQAQELLLSNLDDEADLEPGSCKALCEELDGIPFAIVQASAFMHQNSMTAEEYLEYYQQSSDAQISLLSEDFEDPVRDKDSKNLRTFVFGKQHRRTFEALILAVNALYEDDQIDKARMFGQEAVQLIRAAADPSPSLIAWKIEIMGFVQMVDGGMPDEYFRKALEIRVAAFGLDHAEVLRL
ncbi:hypothetical protein BDW62DRAFT_199094 [Aspergillus aurantiobrunneus]